MQFNVQPRTWRYFFFFFFFEKAIIFSLSSSLSNVSSFLQIFPPFVFFIAKQNLQQWGDFFFSRDAWTVFCVCVCVCFCLILVCCCITVHDHLVETSQKIKYIPTNSSKYPFPQWVPFLYQVFFLFVPSVLSLCRGLRHQFHQYHLVYSFFVLSFIMHS